MLFGHVDKVSRRGIEGWAADDMRPDDAIDVSIFIGGRKVAQLVCDRPREDLLRTGQYGNGHHGFSYRFPKSVVESVEARISVRFSSSGSPLTGGDCNLDGSGVRVIPPAAPLAEDEPVMMPAPRGPRALFDLLAWYDERLGLPPLISRLDLDGQKPQSVHYSVFGMLSESLVSPPADGRYYPRDHLNELLLSDEFQTEMLPRLLRAYEEKQRLIFVHIPKCAGTDLSNKLKTRYPWVDFNIMDSDWTTKDAMLRHLSRLATQIRFADRLYLCGHGGLNYYARNHLIRPTDQVFTIVRQPSDVILSQVNYVLTRFWLDAERGEVGPDTQEWLGLIGIDMLPPQMSEDFVHQAGMKVLQNTDIVRPNSICYWLAGKDADAQAALDSLIGHDVEVTDTRHYGEWLAQRWKIHSQSRDNSSMKFLTMEMLPREYREYIRDISAEDMKLYRMVDRSIARLGKPSVIGRELTGGLE
jgi:hypothetical protein